MTGEKNCLEAPAGGGCPRHQTTPSGTDDPEICTLIGQGAPSPGGDRLLHDVRALLGCRAFLWDVLLDGEWSGCARKCLRILNKHHGAQAVADAFDNA